MQRKIPKYLFRGDRDDNNIRFLRDTVSHYQLQSNLINGGNGREITEGPIINFIDKHVNYGWETTHFLSFTENRTIAECYGAKCNIDAYDFELFKYSEIEFTTKNWDFVIITIDTDKIVIKEIGTGIYEGSFIPSLAMFKNEYKLILINVFEFLKLSEGYEVSKKNSKRDEEWLVFPATCIKLNNNQIEFSAILDGACISQIEAYKK